MKASEIVFDKYPDYKKVSQAHKDLVGRIPVDIHVTEDLIVMLFSDGSYCRWHHFQDCCESVAVEDINGDFNDMLNHPLLVAEERSNQTEEDFVSETWTFYTFRSLGGSVDVRWYGESNGYYSEEVSFELYNGEQQ